MTPELTQLLSQARARWEAMSDDERAAMIKAQAASWAHGEQELAKHVKKHWENGVLVYDDYESYCLD